MRMKVSFQSGLCRRKSSTGYGNCLSTRRRWSIIGNGGEKLMHVPSRKWLRLKPERNAGYALGLPQMRGRWGRGGERVT